MLKENPLRDKLLLLLTSIAQIFQLEILIDKNTQ